MASGCGKSSSVGGIIISCIELYRLAEKKLDCKGVYILQRPTNFKFKDVYLFCIHKTYSEIGLHNENQVGETNTFSQNRCTELLHFNELSAQRTHKV